MASKALEIAGKTEAKEGRVANRGKMVDVITQRAGMPKPKSSFTEGWQWCMCFVYYCYDLAADCLKVLNTLLKTPSCSRQLKYAKMIGSGMTVIPMRMVGASNINILPGDIMIHKSGVQHQEDIGRMWQGHTGICSHKLSNGKIRVREGNTNAAGSREGNTTAWKDRPIDYFLALIRVN